MVSMWTLILMFSQLYFEMFWRCQETLIPALNYTTSAMLFSFCQSHVMWSTTLSNVTLGSALSMYKTPLTLFPVRAIGRVEMLAVLVCRNIHVVRHSVTTRPLSAAILDRKNALYGERNAFPLRPHSNETARLHAF